jgi:hypothetical protein
LNDSLSMMIFSCLLCYLVKEKAFCTDDAISLFSFSTFSFFGLVCDESRSDDYKKKNKFIIYGFFVSKDFIMNQQITD